MRFWQAITVQRSHNSSEHVDTRGGRLVVTDAARDAVGRLCRDHGRLALRLCWPGGAVCLPLSLYMLAAFDVIAGHIGPIYVDVRQLRFAVGTPRRSRRDSSMEAATTASAQAHPTPEPAPRRLTAAAPR